MVDTKSVGLCLLTSFLNIFGWMTLNNFVAITGILAALTTVIYNSINIYLKIKKKNGDGSNK